MACGVPFDVIRVYGSETVDHDDDQPSRSTSPLRSRRRATVEPDNKIKEDKKSKGDGYVLFSPLPSSFPPLDSYVYVVISFAGRLLAIDKGCFIV